MRRVLLLFLVIITVTFSEVEYEDLPHDHWAYNSVKTLVDKEILEQDGYTFKGELALKRYDFVYILAKMLNKIEVEKANKEDLLILEKLVSEFSEELMKIGFDTESFNTRIENLNETVQLMKTTIDMQQKLIDELTKRVEKLEQ